MEYSVGSSVHKAFNASKGAADQEESGWTAYLEDVPSSNTVNYEEHSTCSSFGTSSLVSDAGSGVAWKLSSPGGTGRAPRSTSKRLNYKKTRSSREVLFSTDPLEDTASSPVSSPKGKGMNFHGYSEAGTDGRNIMKFEDAGSECTAPKKRGLRSMVPFSKNYFA